MRRHLLTPHSCCVSVDFVCSAEEVGAVDAEDLTAYQFAYQVGVKQEVLDLLLSRQHVHHGEPTPRPGLTYEPLVLVSARCERHLTAYHDQNPHAECSERIEVGLNHHGHMPYHSLRGSD